MVTIEINEKVADLVNNASIDVSFKSPLADGVNASRSFSLPFKLSSTATMLTHLKNIHRLDTQADGETLDARLKLYDQLIEKGVYRIEKANSQYIDGHYESENRNYDELLKEKKVQSLLPTIVIPKTHIVNWRFRVRSFSNMQGQQYSFVINDSNITYTSTATDTPTSVAAHFAQRILLDLGINASFNAGVLVIAPIQQQLIRIKPWLCNNFEVVSYMTFGQARQNNFTDFITGCFDAPREDISFGFMFNSGLYDGKNTIWAGEINPMYRITPTLYVPKNGFVVNDDLSPTKGHWIYTYVPFLRVRYLLKKIAESIGITKIEADFEGFEEMMSDLVVYNTYPLDEVMEEWQFDTGNNTDAFLGANVGVAQIDLKNHIIDITAADFLDDFSKTFNLSWDIREGKLVFKLMDLVLRNQPLEGRIKMIPNTSDRVFKKREGFKFFFKKDDKDKASSDQVYTEGLGKYEFELPIAPLTETTLFGKRYVYANQKSKDEGLLRFFFDRGVQPSNLNTEYLQTGSDNINNVGNEQWILSLMSQKLYWFCFREIMRLKSHGFPITFKARLRLNDLSEMTKWQTIMYAVNSPEGSFVIGIEEAIVSADINGMKEVKITGIGRY